MELCIVSGFLVFLPKYLETQFSISKSQANLYSGGIAVPGACVGIFLGGYLLKKLQLKPKGNHFLLLAVVFVLISIHLDYPFQFIWINAPELTPRSPHIARRHTIRALLQSRLHGALHGIVSIFLFVVFFIFADLRFSGSTL